MGKPRKLSALLRSLKTATLVVWYRRTTMSKHSPLYRLTPILFTLINRNKVLKKSFIIHKDSLDVLDDLTAEQAGELFKAIKSYHLDEEITLSPIVKIAFSPFKAQFARDHDKYEKASEKNKLNGAKGGRPPKPMEPNKPTGLNGNPNNPPKGDSDSDSDSDSVSKRLYSDDDKRLAEYIFQGVLQVAPKTKQPNIDNWSNTVRLMREQDNHTHKEIAQVFKWAINDDFWKTNIQSPIKLRKQFASLHSKMVNPNENPKGFTTANEKRAELASHTYDYEKAIDF